MSVVDRNPFNSKTSPRKDFAESKAQWEGGSSAPSIPSTFTCMSLVRV